MRKIIVTLTCVLIANTTFALNKKTHSGIEYPNDETFINNEEHYRITATCNEIGNTNKIDCSFNQVMIIPNNENADKYFNEMISEFRVDPKNTLSVLEKSLCKIDAQTQNKYYSYSNSSEWKKFLFDIKKFCSSPNQHSYMAILTDQHIMDGDTCSIFDKTYTEDFTYNNSTSQWVHQSEPQNTCGVIDIAYIKKDPRKGFRDFAWIYTGKNIITNKSGTYMGAKCSLMESDEKDAISYSIGTMLYDDQQYLNCRFIKFSGL